MAGQDTLERVEVGRISARGAIAPEISVRLVAALLALAVATVHVADQGGITVLNSPAWMGWGFRLIEIGGVLTALVILARPGPAGPACLGRRDAAQRRRFIGYITTRTVGVPGDPHDVGNWGYWIGTVSLIIEAALVTLSASMLLVRPQRPAASR